jgi:hypothetical protein
MPKMKYERNPYNKDTAIEDGYLDCGSPYQYPDSEQEGKPDPGHMTSRDSRLHSGGNSTGSGRTPGHIAYPLDRWDFW